MARNKVKEPTKEERITNAVRAVRADIDNPEVWYEFLWASVAAMRQGTGIGAYHGEKSIRKGLGIDE